ncbi:hypothetical protein BDN67DRAFT_986541 [Paxillus ammoniavirescens]|nr:hypothetical protein BDN67DRAFT_986541 [Paxillus ammoniavirescens]
MTLARVTCRDNQAEALPSRLTYFNYIPPTKWQREKMQIPLMPTNKAERSKARDFALVKKDTRDLEDEVEKLEASSGLSPSDKSRLADLKNELTKIMGKKEEYVKDHPEQRKLVYRPRRREKGDDQTEALPVEQKRNLFNKHGLPRHPERSIYYDPVMNPYGVPPPGMPYLERHSDEDIVMPEGPPPAADMEGAESDSDDDIPMPEGPPPSVVQSSVPAPPPPPPPFLGSASQSHIPPNISFPPGFGTGPPGAVPQFPPPTALQPMPPPPPGFFPRRAQSAASIQDPLLSIPHQTYQALRSSQLPLRHPSLPVKPPIGPSGPVSATSVHAAGAIISAEPELRDLKKEATAFMPASLKRKRASALPVSSKINAAPSVNVGSDSAQTSPQSRPDLVGTLKGQFGAGAVPAVPAPSNSKAPAKKLKESIVRGKDDYQKFVDDMSDLLGTSHS